MKPIESKPKTKTVKVNVPTIGDTDDIEGIHNLVLFLVLILGNLPKVKIEFMTELSIILFDIRLNAEQILNKYV